MLTHLSLFTGIGGLDIAAEMAGFTTIGQCEKGAYPTKILEKHWPDVPRWSDIKELTGDSFHERTGIRTIDIISGGFPCQPFSVAGKQKGKEDERYLWPEMLRVIRELMPSWVIGENVSGIIKLAGDAICKDLEREGYSVGIFNYEAAAVGAPHRRERVFFVAHSDRNAGNTWRSEPEGQSGEAGVTASSDVVGHAEHNGLFATEIAGSDYQASHEFTERSNATGKSAGASKSRNDDAVAYAESDDARRLPIGAGKTFTGFSGFRQNVRNATGEGLSHRASVTVDGQKQEPQSERSDRDVSNTDNRGETMWRNRKFSSVESSKGSRLHIRGGTPKYVTGQRRSVESGLGGMADGLSCWAYEPDIPRIAAGIKNRVDRLKCLGNAVVPQQAYPIFAAIASILEKERE